MRAEEFAQGIRLVLDVPVHLQDERLTTVEAERALRDAGVDAKKSRRAIDQVSASLILRAYLDRPVGKNRS